MKTAYDIVLAPVISERSMDEAQKRKYTFKVAKSATKTDVKRAVEAVFGVKVARVNTVNVNGKKKRMGRSEGMTSAYKKAIVMLAPDSKGISFFESLA